MKTRDKGATDGATLQTGTYGGAIESGGKLREQCAIVFHSENTILMGQQKEKLVQRRARGKATLTTKLV